MNSVKIGEKRERVKNSSSTSIRSPLLYGNCTTFRDGKIFSSHTCALCTHTVYIGYELCFFVYNVQPVYMLKPNAQRMVLCFFLVLLQFLITEPLFLSLVHFIIYLDVHDDSDKLTQFWINTSDFINSIYCVHRLIDVYVHRPIDSILGQCV